MVITDSRRLVAPGDDETDATLLSFVRAVVAAGVDAVQVRERDWPDGRLLRVVREACAAVSGSACRVFVNERAHVAMAAGAQGVHLRGTGMPASRVRRVLPGAMLVGQSVHVGDEAAVLEGVDVAVFGTVFPSTSKGGDAPVAGLDGLANWTRLAEGTPVIAVGGMDLERCASVRRAGACGVAAIDLFIRAWQMGEAPLTSLVQEIHTVFREGERAE